MKPLVDSVPATPDCTWTYSKFSGWVVYFNNFKFRPLEGDNRKKAIAIRHGEKSVCFDSYLDMMWWCGTYGMNPTEKNN
jgi:hypothetical protein